MFIAMCAWFLMQFTGCTTTEEQVRDIVIEILSEVDNEVDIEQPVKEEPVAPVIHNAPIDIQYLHTADVKDWKVVTPLNVTLTDKYIQLDYTASWKPKGDVAGNLWLIVQHDGRWIASTCEWLREGQKLKQKKCVSGDHIKREPLKDYAPVKGEKIGFFVSTLARDSRRNGNERSEIAWVTW